MPRYLISLTDENAARMEAMLGGGMFIAARGPASGPEIASVDAITDEEYAPVRERLSRGGPLYHAGGPGSDQARRSREVRAQYARQQQERRVAVLGAHRAEEFESVARDHSNDGYVPLGDVLDLMIGAWETGRSPHHNQETS